MRGCFFLEDDEEFGYFYENIHKKIFKKTILPNGQRVYLTQNQAVNPQSFLASKAKGTKRIFIVGGSVALPFQSEGYGRYLRDLLEAAFPGNKFEVISCGAGGFDSYRDSLVQKEILHYSPDLIIVMSGNNEFYNPIKKNLFVHEVNRLLRGIWVYRKLQDRFGVPVMNRLRYKNRKSYQDELLVNFKNNLKNMVVMAKRKKIPIVLCTLPVNSRDCPPREYTSLENKHFFSVKIVFDKENFEDARIKFEQYVTKNPDDALGYYFLARCYDELGRYPEAQKYYFAAIDFDNIISDRCKPSYNRIIRLFCSQKDVILCDLEKAFINIAPHGLMGKEMFSDNCHWWPKYNSLVCEEIARAIISHYNNSLQLNKSDVDIVAGMHDSLSVRQMLDQATFITDSDKATLCLKYVIGSIAIAVEDDESLSGGDFINERILHFIKITYGYNPQLFTNISTLKKTILELFSGNELWVKVMEPFSEQAWLTLLSHVGFAFYQLKEYSKAIEYFDEAISLNSGSCLPRLGRGLVYYEQKETNKAKIDFEQIDRSNCQQPMVGFYRDYVLRGNNG